MSPNRLSHSITSKLVGVVASRIAAVSTYTCSSSTSGYSFAISETTARHSRDVSSTLALSIEATLRRRSRARVNATRATRSISCRE